MPETQFLGEQEFDSGFRLEEALQDTVDLYAPADPTVDANKKRVPRNYPNTNTQPWGTPTYSNVQCRYVPTDDFEALEGMPPILGLLTVDNLLTQDRFYFRFDQPVTVSWKIVLKTPGHVDRGQVWIANGESKDEFGGGIQFAAALEKKIYAKKTEEKAF